MNSPESGSMPSTGSELKRFRRSWNWIVASSFDSSAMSSSRVDSLERRWRRARLSSCLFSRRRRFTV